MKYALIASAIALVLYSHGEMVPAGFFGYMAGIFYLYTYRSHPTMLAIGCIATMILTIMYLDWTFSLEGYMQVGVAWSMTIVALTVVLTLVTVVHKLLRRD